MLTQATLKLTLNSLNLPEALFKLPPPLMIDRCLRDCLLVAGAMPTLARICFYLLPLPI